MWKVIAISAGIIGIIWIIVGGPCVCAAADTPQISATHSSFDSLTRVSISDKIARMPVTNVADILRTQVGITVRSDQFHVRGTRSNEILYPAPDCCLPGFASPARMLDSLYHSPILWTLKSDCECDRWSFDLNRDGVFDLLDVLISADWEVKWEQWSGRSRMQATR